MRRFIFESYTFDPDKRSLDFTYSFDGEYVFTEHTEFPESGHPHNPEVLDAALRHAFLVLGVSYFRSFPDSEIVIKPFDLSKAQAEYFNTLYREGLGEFWFVNNLTPDVFKGFPFKEGVESKSTAFDGNGLLLMSTGGKDSLLASLLLQKVGKDFTPIFMGRDNHYPKMLDEITGEPPMLIERRIDWDLRRHMKEEGGLVGHVPFSAMLASVFLIATILTGRKIVVASNESSANEGNAKIGDFVANHAWSKSFKYELMLQDYIHTFISPDLEYVSLVRAYTDLYISEMFVELGWKKYGHKFASCNVANYKQGKQTETLVWCGHCDKCANTWLTFSPFLDPEELISVFGRNLIKDPDMKDNFLNLLGLGKHKPFECVGTIEELRTAYHMASEKHSEYALEGVEIPKVEDYDYRHLDDQQPLAAELLGS